MTDWSKVKKNQGMTTLGEIWQEFSQSLLEKNNYFIINTELIKFLQQFQVPNEYLNVCKYRGPPCPMELSTDEKMEIVLPYPHIITRIEMEDKNYQSFEMYNGEIAYDVNHVQGQVEPNFINYDPDKNPIVLKFSRPTRVKIYGFYVNNGAFDIIIRSFKFRPENSRILNSKSFIQGIVQSIRPGKIKSKDNIIKLPKIKSKQKRVKFNVQPTWWTQYGSSAIKGGLAIISVIVLGISVKTGYNYYKKLR